MKNMYLKNKGKVYPSPSSSSTIFYCCTPPPPPPPPPPSRDALSMLKILPAAILALASVLSPEDREVLAYMITRSMKTSNPSLMIEENKKCKKSNHHKSPIFECGCFDCYTIYWFRWDSSPNRELIHHAIEAFEEHLTNGELSKKNNGRGKKKDRMSHRGGDKSGKETQGSRELLELDLEPVPGDDALAAIVSDGAGAEDEEEEDDKQVVVEEEGGEGGGWQEVKCMNMAAGMKEQIQVPAAGMEAQIQVPATGSERNHKGLARKVLPGVLGLFNSRLWSLWSPSV